MRHKRLLAATAILFGIFQPGCSGEKRPAAEPVPARTSKVVTPEEIAKVRAIYERSDKAAAQESRPLFGSRLASLPDFRRWGVRETAVDALARIGQEAVPALIDTLQNPDSSTRANAARALSRMGPRAEPAVPALIAALGDSDREVRQSAARALGQIGPAARAAVPALIEALHDPDTTGADPAYP